MTSTASIKENVVIIIPTYNEAHTIKDTIVQVFDEVDLMADFETHLLVFDSASMDNTQQIIVDLQKRYPKLHLQSESKKTGLGSAYLQAMRYALSALNADIVFEFDADLSHQPKYIKPMLELIKECDVVVGSRYVAGGSIPSDWGWRRKALSVLGNYVSRVVLTAKYRDMTSGFRATRRAFLQKVLPDAFLSNHYAYKLQLLWLLHKHSADIREYPIDFIDRQQGESKLPANSIKDSLRVIGILRYQELERYFKMCLVGLSGMGVQILLYNLLRVYLSPFNASQIAIMVAIVSNFILNNRFTFKTDAKANRLMKLKRLTSFSVYSLLTIYLQSSWMQLGIHYLGHGFFRENSLLVIGIGLGSLLNYFAYTRHIWAIDERIKA